MSDEVGLDEIYAEVDKRIKAAVEALKAELVAEIAKKQNLKEPFRITRKPVAS
jgi:hypothetical protein